MFECPLIWRRERRLRCVVATTSLMILLGCLEERHVGTARLRMTRGHLGMAGNPSNAWRWRCTIVHQKGTFSFFFTRRRICKEPPGGFWDDCIDVEVRPLQSINKIVDIRVMAQRQIHGQTIQKTLVIPQLQHIDKVLDVSVVPVSKLHGCGW